MRVVHGFATASLVLTLSRAVLGSLFVITPKETTVCHGGQLCSVQWLDDGVQPLLATMGPCYVSLYAGDETLVQQIQPVDVSTTHSLTFTPDPSAGPNSNTYFLQFSSVNSSDPSHPLIAFSPNFSLDRMSGSFRNPVPELTSSIPVPSSVLSAHPNSISTTLLSENSSRSTSPTSSSSSPLLSSRPTLTSPSTSTTSSKSNAAARHPLPERLSLVTLLGLSISFLV